MYSHLLLTLLVVYASPILGDEIFAGGLPDGPPTHIQDCAYGGDYAGLWTDGAGTYVNSDSVRLNIGKKCWNDYLVVKTTNYFGPWYQIGGEFFCTGTSLCTSGVTHSQQSCFTQTSQISVNIGVEAVGISLGASYTESWSESHCYTDEKTNQCTWNDKDCHAIWGQNQMVRQQGYKRERCNVGHGDFTNCMSDWETTFPSGSVNYGCGSKCGDTNPCGHTDGTPCPSGNKRTVPQDLIA